MPSRPIHIASLAIALALCASCSKEAQEGAPRKTEDVSEAPNVSPTAAPGVAWRYAYDFQLPDDAIQGVQEAHASECEAMGLARCRITGLRYSVTDDNAVSAMLEVKLAPDIARQFGKQATADVRKADGRLSNTEFSGEDTGPALSEATHTQGDLQSRMTQIEKQLANRSLKDAERAQLQSQLDQLKSQLGETRSAVAQTQETLASTPMTFNYSSKGGINGFAGRNPVRDAARSFVASLVTMISFVLQVLAVLLPWVILLSSIYLAARSRPARAVGRFFSRRPDADTKES